MGRKPAQAPIVRKTIALPEHLWAEISAHRFDNRISTEADAVRQLLQAGLKALSDAAHRKQSGGK